MSFRFALLALLAVSSIAASATARPGDPPPRDVVTAFPDIVPPKTERDDWDLTRVLPRITGGARQPILPTDPVRRQIRMAQLNELAVLAVKMNEVIRIGGSRAEMFYRLAYAILTAGEIGAELEDTPAGRVPWYEERVLGLKLIEQVVRERIPTRRIYLHVLNEVRYFLYGAELDLLRADELARAEGRPRPADPSPAHPPFDDFGRQPAFTAFPQFEPPPFDPEHPRPFLDPAVLPRTVGRKPFEIDPADPPLVKARRAAVNAGLACLRQLGDVVQVGRIWPDDIPAALLLVYDLAAVGGRLEPNAIARIGWFAEWVVVAKTFERYARARVQAGTDAPQMLNYVRALRLESELQLHTAWDPPVRTLPRPGKPAPPGEFTATPELRPSPLALRTRPQNGEPTPIPTRASPRERLALTRFIEVEEYLDRTTRPDWRYDFLHEPTRPGMLAATPLIDLEDTADGQAWWLGVRAALLNDEEAALGEWARPDRDSRPLLGVLRFYRLKAEADLLEFKAEAEQLRR